jgi:hypothetical protein
MTCPKCDSTHTEVRESRKLANGTRRRRMGCKACEHRWTLWDGPKPAPGESAKGRTAPPREKRQRLTPEQVHFALVRLDLSNRDIAEQIDCTRETVRLIRAGALYRGVHPELLRPGTPRPKPDAMTPSCDKCSHWKGERCGFGFPDPILEGLLFASDCDLYRQVSQSISLA